MFKGKVEQVSPDYLKKLTENLKNARVKVGVLDTAGNYEDESTVAEVAATNEFGDPSKKIPERSFIRETVQEQVKNYNQLSKKLSKEILTMETTPKSAINTLGEFMKSKIIAKFTRNNWKPNSELTKELKGSDTPLIDSGRLRQSISYEVIKDK